MAANSAAFPICARRIPSIGVAATADSLPGPHAPANRRVAGFLHTRRQLN
jgi:hypothetical protein